MEAIIINNPIHKMIKIANKSINLLNNNYLKNNLITIFDYVSIFIDYHDWVALCLMILWAGSAILPFVSFSLFDDKNNHNR